MTEEKQEMTTTETETPAEAAQPAEEAVQEQAAAEGAVAAEEGAVKEEKEEAAETKEEETAPKKERRWYPRRRKYCRFCAEKREPDYKDPEYLRQFLTDRFKIIPRRITGTCAYHQRRLTKAVKRARILALLPYTTLHKGWFTHEVQKVVRER